MNVFQLIVIPLVIALFVRSLWNFFRNDRGRRVWLAAALTWLLSGLSVLRPDVTILVAKSLGIGRGADLVLYVVAILFIASFFYHYAKFQRIESQITELVRHIALTNAQPRDDAQSKERSESGLSIVGVPENKGFDAT
jgi:hypothetical protein